MSFEFSPEAVLFQVNRDIAESQEKLNIAQARQAELESIRIDVQDILIATGSNDPDDIGDGIRYNLARQRLPTARARVENVLGTSANTTIRSGLYSKELNKNNQEINELTNRINTLNRQIPTLRADAEAKSTREIKFDTSSFDGLIASLNKSIAELREVKATDDNTAPDVVVIQQEQKSSNLLPLALIGGALLFL